VRRPKINFPTYNSEVDPLPWLNKCGTYFRGMGTAPEKWVWMASLHIEGITEEWYYALKHDVGLLPWTHFSEFVIMRFGPPSCIIGLADLKDLWRTTTAEEYQCQFLMLLCHCDNMTPIQQVHMFTAGLGEPLHTDVDLALPTDLQVAMNLAQAYERHLAAAATNVKMTHTSGARSSSMTASSAAASTMTRPHFCRLCPDELAAKRVKGKCYYCPKKFSNDHKCKYNGVFLLKLNDDDEVEVVADDLGISLHALTSIDIADIMKLHIQLNGKTLVALVDTGSTHTFVQEEVATQLDLPVTP
jgi:hypothetical protein